jgi:purine-binding chemotaxis protein CheW
MPVVDLRKRMGFASALEETKNFCTMMQQREQDHRNWVNELEASVKERRPFGLTSDPHKCAFGKWYDSYHADNAWFAALLKKFDVPHQQIHGVAVEVEKLKASQAFDKAEQLIGQTRDGLLAKLVKLFAELQDLVRDTERETAVVLASENRLFAISVDVAHSIEKFPAGNIEEVSSLVPIAHNGVARRLARRAKSKDVILLIETDSLMAGCNMAALPPSGPSIANAG